jgi:hypothetical protein
VEQYQKQLDRYQFQMGTSCGRLATALDVLTDALALVGQHGVYCRNPGAGKAESMDIRLVMQQLEDSKLLILETMKELQKSPGTRKG